MQGKKKVDLLVVEREHEEGSRGQTARYSSNSNVEPETGDRPQIHRDPARNAASMLTRGSCLAMVLRQGCGILKETTSVNTGMCRCTMRGPAKMAVFLQVSL